MRPKNRFLGLFFIIPLLTHALWAGNVGTRGPAVLELETGVRAIGMGGAYTGVSDDASALYWNPAGLQQTKQQEVQLMRTESFVGQTENRVAYTRPTWRAGERKTWGLSVHHLALPDFDVVEENESVGSVRPQEFAVGLSHSRPLFGVFCGMSLKWVKTEMFEESGQTVAADFGILGTHPEGWGWGMALANVGPSMKLGSDKIGLPTTVRGGLSKRLPLGSGEWVAAGDVDYTVEGDPSGRAGLEYNLPVGRDWRVALRSGVRTTEEGRFSFGGGVGRGPLDLNYAFTAFGDLGSTSRMDFTLRFGGELAPEVRRRELIKMAKDATAKGDLPKARQAVEELKTLSPRSKMS
ncbi:MAG: PorV/PorQ family protein [Elusimicrobia bacterium]|nr:PorV/PorQ family protein [Elusimicrobiota bacterium]